MMSQSHLHLNIYLENKQEKSRSYWIVSYLLIWVRVLTSEYTGKYVSWTWEQMNS